LVWEEMETQNSNKGVGGFIPAVRTRKKEKKNCNLFYFLFDF